MKVIFFYFKCFKKIEKRFFPVQALEKKRKKKSVVK